MSKVLCFLWGRVVRVFRYDLTHHEGKLESDFATRYVPIRCRHEFGWTGYDCAREAVYIVRLLDFIHCYATLRADTCCSCRWCGLSLSPFIIKCLFACLDFVALHLPCLPEE